MMCMLVTLQTLCKENMHINKDVLTKNPPNYKCKLYETIRNNGGWSNWTMEIISFFNCQDHYEARKKEQEYFISLNATLNSIEPMPKPKIKSIKVVENKIKTTPNTHTIFECIPCDFKCINKKDYKRHILTRKHTILLNITPNTDTIFECKCGKEYNHRQSLSVHKKKCNISTDSNTNNLIAHLIKENSEFKQMMIEQQNMMMEFIKNGTHNTTNNTNS